MQTLNRTATATASAVETLFVIGCVVINGAGGALIGAAIGAGQQLRYGSLDNGAAVFGFLIGAAIGFVIASLIVSMSMNLREIALNTRQLVELNGGSTALAAPEIATTPTTARRKDDPRLKS